MVSKFEIINEKKQGLEIDLKTGVLKNYSFEHKSKILYDSKYKGVRWFDKKLKTELIHEEKQLFGLPSIDLQYVIIVHYCIKDNYPLSLEAEIYKSDGKFYKSLKLPELQSDLAKKSRIGQFGLFFENVAWVKDSIGNNVISIKIGYNRDWWESRALNPETGEFGEVLSSGMR